MIITDKTPNVMQINKVIDKTTAAMTALAKTAESAGIDLRPERDGIERALTHFFTNLDTRESASAANTGGA